MDNAIYTAISRQSALRTELDVIANNVANAATTGFRRESAIFSEFIKQDPLSEDSLAMTRIGAHHTDLSQGALRQTGGPFDFAIEGEGYFQILHKGAPHLTRAGHFTPNAEGQLVTPDGDLLLDQGGAAIQIPQGAEDIKLARDGTLSVDGQPLAQVGLVVPEEPTDMTRVGQNLFAVQGGQLPVDGPQVHQGALEGSNVNPVREIARLIEVQRRYEAGQSFLDREDNRIKTLIQTLGR